MERDSCRLTDFSFVCPEDRVSETVELIKSECDTVACVFVGGKTTRIVVGEEETPRGIEVSGSCLVNEDGVNRQLTDLLSKNRIAGYSRATQVFYVKKRGEDE